jgi:hypothetical protein
LAKIPKSSDFRIVNATGVYALPSEAELRLIFIGQEPYDIELEGDQKLPLISEGPHIQAQIILKRDLADWIRKYLNEYLKQPADAPKQPSESSNV